MHLLFHVQVFRLYYVYFHCTPSELERETKPDCDGWKAHVITTQICQTQRWLIKMPYLNQMYEKKAIEGYA